MHVGPEGTTVKELVELVRTLQLSDWESSKSKKSHVSGVVGKEPRFVRVTHFKYTLRCFPGVVEYRPPGAMLCCATPKTRAKAKR